jgi:phospholipid-binding lipoprotein MlaA
MITGAFTSVLGPMLLLSATPEQPIGPFSLEASASVESNVSTLPTDAETDHEIVVTSNARGLAADPLRAVNEKSFEATVAVDDAIARPIALAYVRAVPEPLRQGLRNVLDNLAEPVTFVNYVLQLKPLSACKTVARFIVNSTIGLAGVFDIGKRRPFNLARHRTGFADTLGFYGVKPGAFFYLPLVGPTTVRDILGGLVDRAFLPFVVGKPFGRASYTIPVGILSAVDRRGRTDSRIQLLRTEPDPYLASRSAYLERRKARIDTLKSGGE